MKKQQLKSFFGSFVFYFLLQFKFLNDWWFGTDELDIMVLGKGIARGQLLYKDLCSQHMPFTYYIGAFFDFMGFKTVDEQRLAFYLLTALLWAVIYVRYSHVINSKALFWAPAVICSLMQNYEYGTQFLSEHLAGCGAMILLLEFLDFIETKRLSYSTCVMISISVVLTFGTVFVGIYAVFFIALGVLLYEIKWLFEDKKKILTWIMYMLKKYIKLIVIVAVPWIVLFIYYIATGTLGDFIYGAYTLNRTIYAEYIGGMGGNILSLFIQPIDMLGGFISNTMALNTWTYSTVLQWLMILGGIIYLGKEWMNGRRIVAVILLMFTYALGVRGIYNFHGTPCVEVLVLFFVQVLFNDLIGDEIEFKKKSIYSQAFVYILIVFVASGYLRDISEVATIKVNDDEMNTEAQIINAITNENEPIWCFGFHNDVLMLADRFCTSGYPATPWTWKAYKKKFKKDKKAPARVVLYDEEHMVWNYVQKEYAPSLYKFMSEEYTRYNDTYIYIRKDYYDKAIDIIQSIDE